jgi:hypothetical protein
MTQPAIAASDETILRVSVFPDEALPHSQGSAGVDTECKSETGKLFCKCEDSLGPRTILPEQPLQEIGGS